MGVFKLYLEHTKPYEKRFRTKSGRKCVEKLKSKKKNVVKIVVTTKNNVVRVFLHSNSRAFLSSQKRLIYNAQQLR